MHSIRVQARDEYNATVEASLRLLSDDPRIMTSIYYVKAGGVGLLMSSWTDAFSNLQDALEVSRQDDWVAGGTCCRQRMGTVRFPLQWSQGFPFSVGLLA